MPPSNPLKTLRNLDGTSPDFHNQLVDLIRGSEYRDAIPNLEGEGLAWLVDYLENVSLHNVSPHPALTAGPRSSAISLIPAVSRFENRWTSSKGYVASRMCSRKRTRFQILCWDACMRAPSTVRGYASGVCERTPKEIHRRSKRYVSHFMFSAPGRSQIPQAFHQMAVVRKHMKHPNIVPLLGVTLDPPQLISDHMPDGSLTEYIKSHPDADRISLVSDPSVSL